MDVIIPEYYKEYGLYTTRSKMLPSILDGLIPVHRRMILGAYSIAKNSFVKTVKVMGEVIGKWHPHAEQVGAIEWCVQNGFLEGSGWWGSKLGSDPSKCAAPRYTSVKLGKKSYNLGLKYVDYVEWKPDELDPEPVAFPTLLPFVLVGKYIFSLPAFGRKTTIPTYNEKDLIERLFDKNKVIKPKIIGTDCISNKQELKDLLEKSEKNVRFPIKFQVKHFIDEKDQKIYILSCPDFKLEKIIKKFGKLWTSGDIGYVEIPVSKDLKKKLKATNDETVCFVFSPAKKRGASKIFEDMVKVVDKLKFMIHFEVVVFDNHNNCMRQVSVDEFLQSSFNYFSQTFNTYLTKEIARLQQLLEEYEIIKAIQPYLNKFITSKAFYETKLKELEKLTGYSADKINYVVNKYRIKTILNFSYDTKEVKEKLEETKKKLKNIELEIKNEYESFLNNL